MIEDTQFFNDALLSGFYEWSKKSVEALIDANKNASLLDDSELKQNIKRGLEEAISYTTEIFAYSVGKEWSLQDGTVVYEHGEDGFKKLREKYNLEEVFTKNSPVTQKVLRGYVERHNMLEYKCQICECDGNWQNGIIALELDHINGDNTDDRIENLRYLCPNCHALTETYRGRNKALKKIECREHTPTI